MLSENEENIRHELSKLMKHFQCPICLNLMSDPMVTRCMHHFCGHCITKAIESSSADFCRCPLCNDKISKRSLRSQLDIFDMIQTLKAAVDSFENDNQMSLITDNEDVVIFDVSSDKSKSCVQSNDSFDYMNESKDMNKSNDKSLDKTNGSVTENSDIESNRRTATITSVSDEWPSCEPSNDFMDHIIEDMNKTDVYFESTTNSLSPNVNSVSEPNPTQSQNLKVNKSRITYGSSRPSTEDRFDRIIRLSESNSNRNQSKQRPKEGVADRREPQMEVQYLAKDPKTYGRKPLIQFNKNQNQKSCQKKCERIANLDSSDEEFHIITTKSGVERDQNSVCNKANDLLSISDNSEDLFLPAIHSKQQPIESKRSNDSLREESRNDFNSDIELITSSPFSQF